MQFMLAQINPTVGDIKGNQKKIIDAIHDAKSKKIDLILFPELALTGYPPEDLLLLPGFIKSAEEALVEIIKETDNIHLVLGTIRQNKSPKKGKPLFNTAAIASNQKIVGFYDKILLPTYDVFDERRYFEPGEEIFSFDLFEKKLVVTICEDIWGEWEQKNHPLELSQSHYPINLTEQIKTLKPDYTLNLSSSPFSSGHFEQRIKVCSNFAKKTHSKLLYCNQVGANDSLIFDGRSLVFDETGQLRAIAKEFKEDLFVIDEKLPSTRLKVPNHALSTLFDALVLGVSDYFRKLGFKKAILGLSGGVDSALVACIAVKALGAENVLTVAMPSSFSSSESSRDAKILSENLGCHFEEIPIDKSFKAYLELLNPYFSDKSFDVTEENLQARIRGMILMAFSNKFGSIVLSTGNKSELALGYCTLYGDMCGGLGVISDLTKGDVYALSNWINKDKEIIPWNTINRPASAELRENQKDQDTLPPYEMIDQVLKSYLEEHLSAEEISKKFHFPLEIVKELIYKIHQNEYKRKQAPPGLRVSNKSFTSGRRFPIVQKWT